jgi:1-acyl-sn-glycerol-3-phosphate acyltransferase
VDQTGHANIRFEDRLPIKLLQAANIFYARIYQHLTVLTPCLVPKQGPAILVCNHTSCIDPAFIQATYHHRAITWMMAKEYLDIKGAGWFFRTIGVIPVERSGRDTGPLRAAIRALEAGKVLGIFPEGRIARSRELLPFQTGVALMAIKTGVPVYPAYIDGTQRNKGMVQAVIERNETTLIFGPPVEFNRNGTSKENLEVATAKIKQAIELLRDAAAR